MKVYGIITKGDETEYWGLEVYVEYKDGDRFIGSIWFKDPNEVMIQKDVTTIRVSINKKGSLWVEKLVVIGGRKILPSHLKKTGMGISLTKLIGEE